MNPQTKNAIAKVEAIGLCHRDTFAAEFFRLPGSFPHERGRVLIQFTIMGSFEAEARAAKLAKAGFNVWVESKTYNGPNAFKGTRPVITAISTPDDRPGKVFGS